MFKFQEENQTPEAGSETPEVETPREESTETPNETPVEAPEETTQTEETTEE